MIRRGYSSDRRELTPRMVAVLEAAASGRTELETAAVLHVSLSTVKAERAAALRRLGARNVTEAVWLARAELAA